MTANRDLERRIADFYATEPPLRAPDLVLHAALSTIDSTPQRRGLLAPWRFPNMTTFTKLAAAVVVAVAVGAIGLWQFAGVGGPTPTPTATPGSTPVASVPPSASPLATVLLASPVTGTTFGQPFDYVLPDVPQFAFGRRNATYWEVRVPAWAEAGHPGGLIVQAIGGGRVDPCDRASAAMPLGASAVFEYLGTIPGMTISNETSVTVDGRSARQAMVHLEPTAGCSAIWAWFQAPESFIDGVDLRLIAVDVAGEPIVITIFGEADNPGWQALADGIVGSFRFQAPG